MAPMPASSAGAAPFRGYAASFYASIEVHSLRLVIMLLCVFEW